MAAHGVRAESLVPVFPSSTFPNHVALATGAHADRHGIVANRFLDAELGLFDYSNDASFIRAEPVWVTAERQGVKAASFFWVGSETDWNGAGATYRRAPFDSKISEERKVTQILAWLDLPAAERPGLILTWWHGADSPGHRFGPDSPRTHGQLKRQDAQLARLMVELDAREAWSDLTLIVVSDHGMTAVGEAFDVRAPLQEAGIGARVFQGGAYAHVHLEDPAQQAAALATLAAVPGLRAYPSDALPESLRYRVPDRTGHVVVLTDPPRSLSRARTLRDGWRVLSGLVGNKTGTHGYDPKHTDMHGVFLAMGRGVPRGERLPRVRSIDVAPTVTHLLGIDPPRDAEGAPIAAIAPGSSSEFVGPEAPLREEPAAGESPDIEPGAP